MFAYYEMVLWDWSGEGCGKYFDGVDFVDREETGVVCETVNEVDREEDNSAVSGEPEDVAYLVATYGLAQIHKSLLEAMNTGSR